MKQQDSIREISKTPEVPILSKQAIELLNALVFQEDAPLSSQADLLFVFGATTSTKELTESLSHLIQANKATTVLFTGGISPYSDVEKNERPEAMRLYLAVKDIIGIETEVILETTSLNTYENVRLGLKKCTRAPASVLFLARNFHTTRALLTLRHFLSQDVAILSSSFVPFYPTVGKKLERHNWQECPEFVSRIWGEYLRIRHYSERGDFDASPVQHLINSIWSDLLAKEHQ